MGVRPVKPHRVALERRSLFDGGTNSASVLISVAIDDTWGEDININL